MATQTTPQIECDKRDKLGSRYAERLRKQGRLPVVIYGHGQDPTHGHVDDKQMHELLHEQTHLIEVTVDGSAQPCLIKAVQWDHLGKEILHMDLARVSLTEDVEIEVELQLKGDPKAVESEEGLVLTQQMNMLTVRCKANAIPHELTLDVTELTSDAPLTVGDVPMPAGVVAVNDAEEPVALLSHVRIAPEPEAGEGEEGGEEGAEPQVIGKQEKQESEGE